jgi:hypothetical protein
MVRGSADVAHTACMVRGSADVAHTACMVRGSAEVNSRLLIRNMTLNLEGYNLNVTKRV